MAQHEEIMNLLETHDVGDGAMVRFARLEPNRIQICFICRCGEPDEITHRRLIGKRFQGRIWDVNKRLFLSGWEPIGTRDGNYFTWIKKGIGSSSLAEC